MADILVDSFVVQRNIPTVPRSNHLIHWGGLDWQLMPFKWEGNMTPDSRYMAYQGMTFLSPYGTAILLSEPGLTAPSL